MERVYELTRTDLRRIFEEWHEMAQEEGWPDITSLSAEEYGASCADYVISRI